MTHTQSVHANQQKPHTESFKETFESVVMAFILAFVFRAFIVEAFVIPTGSMAPTLLGQHMNMTCVECGYRFNTDILKSNNANAQSGFSIALICPMCSYPVKVDAQKQRRPGDRILVHKFIYNLTEPKRWDVVVFKFPGKPQDNFIKRLVGLPDEKLFIIDGNIFTQPLNQPDTPWQIQRKSDREVVQRTIWQPIYHSQYYPLDQGKPSLDRANAYAWQFPWKADDADRFKRVQRTWLAYDGQKPATLQFDFQSMLKNQINFYGRPIGWYPYSQLDFSVGNIEPIEDVRIAINVMPKPNEQSKAKGVGLTFQTTGRTDGLRPVPIRGTLSEDGKISISTGPSLGMKNASDQQWQVRVTDQIQPLPTDRATALEFWYVDQQVSLWVNQKKVLTWDFEVPIDVLKRRPAAPLHPALSVKIQGMPAIITELELDRDLYYSSRPNRSSMALGGLYKPGASRQGDPVAIQKDQFYCLGDNSPFSHDGRYWNDVNPWIQDRLFAGKDQVTGLVPRELMIGKAFFVYFPAPHRLTSTSAGIIPNFGDVRFIH